MINFRETARVMLWLALAVFYAIMPHDLVPEAFGPIGRLDDTVLIIAVVGWIFFRPLLREISRIYSGGHASFNNSNAAEDHNPFASNSAGEDEKLRWACKTLQVDTSSSMQEIRLAYQNLVKQYHPDKVSDLGPELKELAQKKTSGLNQAYEFLKQKKTDCRFDD